MAKKILITGGAGYIGSHTALELLNEGYEVVVYDNLGNSSKESLKRVEELTGKHITFYEGDVMDEAALKEMFEKENVDAVIHCAALKAVGESVQKPLEYYRNNITGTLTLMDVMKQTGVKNIVFSSSASCIIVTVIARLYLKYRNMAALQGILNSLRPAVVAMIAAAGISILITAFWGNTGMISLVGTKWTLVVIFMICVVLLQKVKMNPIGVMALAGIMKVGISFIGG